MLAINPYVLNIHTHLQRLVISSQRVPVFLLFFSGPQNSAPSLVDVVVCYHVSIDTQLVCYDCVMYIQYSYAGKHAKKRMVIFLDMGHGECFFHLFWTCFFFCVCLFFPILTSICLWIYSPKLPPKTQVQHQPTQQLNVSIRAPNSSSAPLLVTISLPVFLATSRWTLGEVEFWHFKHARLYRGCWLLL